MNTNTLRILSLEIVISVTNERGRRPRREALCDGDESLQSASHPRVPRQQRLGRAPGGFLEDFPVLLLTTTGAKSGRPRTTPLMYVTDGGRPVVFASAAGSPKNPAWYHNLVAHPEVGVEIGEESFGAVAVVTEGAERERLGELAVASNPTLGGYPEKMDRRIPLITLEQQGV